MSALGGFRKHVITMYHVSKPASRSWVSLSNTQERKTILLDDGITMCTEAVKEKLGLNSISKHRYKCPHNPVSKLKVHQATKTKHLRLYCILSTLFYSHLSKLQEHIVPTWSAFQTNTSIPSSAFASCMLSPVSSLVILSAFVHVKILT